MLTLKRFLACIWALAGVAFFQTAVSMEAIGDPAMSLGDSQWLVKVAGENRDRKLRITSDVATTSASSFHLSGLYGYVDGSEKPVEITVTVINGKREISFKTPANSDISATQVSPTQFSGYFAGTKGKNKLVSLTRLDAIRSGNNSDFGTASSTLGAGADGGITKNVHFIWMGGNDCPPCVVWRALELPKLKQSPEFSKIHFTYVIKGIKGSVPPLIFLPDEVKVYKSILDDASNSGSGSPQAALVVDGVVFDYFFGTRSAIDIEKMLLSVRRGDPYPFKRCTKMHRMGQTCIQFG